MNKKGSTPLSIVLLVVLTIVLVILTLYTFISSEVFTAKALSPELLDNIYLPQEQITFFMTSMAEEAYDVAKNKPQITEKPTTLEYEFIAELKERLGIDNTIGAGYIFKKNTYIENQKTFFKIKTELLDNRLKEIHYQHLTDQALESIRRGDYITGTLTDILNQYPIVREEELQSGVASIATKPKKLLDSDFIILFYNSLDERVKREPISRDAFIFAFPLKDSIQISRDGKSIFSASYEYVVLIILDNKSPQA